ncbi:hypothetical protein NIES2104_65390 [Leptolyngbya sp. NIES-2104]|nr:hypothetical protein NIES2104_65390 [Leptolyngbya sp. NIES-2104]
MCLSLFDGSDRSLILSLIDYAAFYVALVPVFGVASAMILMGEQPSFVQWIGAVFVIASSYCANRLRSSSA